MAKYLPSLETFAKGTVATLATLSTVSLGILYYGQNYLVYPSAYISIGGQHRTHVDSPDLYGLEWENVQLETEDGESLQCFLLLQRKNLGDPTRFHRISSTVINYDDEETDEDFMSRRPTVIMFHGNGGNAGHRIPLGMMFQLRMRCNVFMLEYRGYGKSTGSPSEAGLQLDAQTALDFVLNDPRLKHTKIFLYGQSIGGAVAIDLASRNPHKISALILENTFTDLPSLVPHLFPFLKHLPYRWMCTEKWDSASKVHKIPPTTPILLLSGGLDELVPQDHMFKLRALFERMGELVYPDPISEKPTPEDGEESGEEVDTNPFGIRRRHPIRQPQAANPPPPPVQAEDAAEIWQQPLKDDQDEASETETLSFATPTPELEDDDTVPLKRPRHSHSFELRPRANTTTKSTTLTEKPSKKKIPQGQKRLTWLELPFGGHNDTSIQPNYWDTIEDFLSPFTGILPRDIRKSVRERERRAHLYKQDEKRRLEEEVIGMEKELSGMDEPVRRGAISTKDLLKEFGLPSEDLRPEENRVELTEAERNLEKEDLVSRVAV